MDDQEIIITDLTGDGGLKPFLEAQLCLSHGAALDGTPEAILRQSPSLGPYLIKKHEVFEPKTEAIWVHIPSPRTESTPSFRSWDIALQAISEAIAVVCSAGASKVFLDLLKTYLEARANREIHIKTGDQEITLKGPVSKEQVDRALRMFEQVFGQAELPGPETTEKLPPPKS